MPSGEVTTELMNLVVETAKTGLSLFNEWPLNVVVIAGVLGISIGIVAKFIPKKRK